MSRDSYRRLGLVAGGMLLAFGLALVWRWFGWPTAVIVAGLGVCFAFAVTVESSPSPVEPDADAEAEPAGLSIRQIRDRSQGRV